jgi:hypothetical protein
VSNLRRWMGVFALGVSLLGASSDAYAQQRPPPPGRPAPVARPPADAPEAPPATGAVSVEVMCVHGTNRHSNVDASLKPIVKQLSYTRYTGFELVDTHGQSLEIGQEATFAIEGERKVKVELLGRDDAAAKLRIRLLNADGAKLLDTTISVHRNKSFMVAGPKVGEDVLILPVTARY